MQQFLDDDDDDRDDGDVPAPTQQGFGARNGVPARPSKGSELGTAASN